MGFGVWAVLTACAGLAGYAVAARTCREHGLPERALTALLVSTAQILLCVQGLALAGVLSRWTLGALAFASSAAIFAAAVRHREGLEQLRSTLRHDAGAPWRLVRDVLARQELAAYGLAMAAVALGVSLFVIWRFPSWSWDVVWYHLPMTNYVVQEGALRWEPTHVVYVNGYPRNVEMLSVWNVLFPRDTRLDDLAQVPFALMGGLAVAAFCRRAGASPALSASLGGMWIALPAVALQIHTTHADIAAGALFVTCFYFLGAPVFAGHARWMALLALGLYVGTKVTGLFHAALLSPLLLARLGLEVYRSPRRGRAIGGIALAVMLALALGGFVYARNVVHTGNPFWPAQLRIPLLGTELPGLLTVDQIAGPPAFFGAPGAFERMIRVWYLRSENYFPDVREGPFGLLFPYLGLPALLVVAVFAPFSRERWQRLSLVLMAGLAVLVPAAWWGRFVLAAPAAGLVSIAIVHRQLRWRLPRALVSAAASFLCVASYAHSVQGYRVLPRPFVNEAGREQDEDRLRRELQWLWPPDVARLREAELREGDVVAYDDSIAFPGELWTRDLRNRVAYAKHEGDDGAWMARLRELRPRWIFVRTGSRGEAMLRERPNDFHPLFQLPLNHGTMYRVTAKEP
jgi:hypothetical protein